MSVRGSWFLYITCFYKVFPSTLCINHGAELLLSSPRDNLSSSALPASYLLLYISAAAQLFWNCGETPEPDLCNTIISVWFQGRNLSTKETGFFPSDAVRPCPCVSSFYFQLCQQDHILAHNLVTHFFIQL